MPDSASSDSIPFAQYTGLLIGGVWKPGARINRIPVSNPSTGENFSDVADASPADAITAVNAAAAAAADWAATPPRKRSEILRKCFELMIRDSEAWRN